MTVAPDPRLGHDDSAKPSEGDERFWSVTTIIGTLDKPALLYWAAEQAAEAACDIAGSLRTRISEDGREAVVKWLRDARFRPRKGQRTATALGSAVHDACEELALTGTWPRVDDEVRPFVENADRLLQRLQPTFEAAEAAVYNRTYGVAGTLDAIAVIDGQRLVLDWKTSRKDADAQGNATTAYPEHALQLAAYRNMELLATFRARRFEKFRRRYYLLSEAEAADAVAMPETDGAMVLHLTPGHGAAVPVRTDEVVWEAFLYAQEVARWQLEVSKTVIGDPYVVVTP